MGYDKRRGGQRDNNRGTGGGRNYGGRDFGGRGQGRPEMHQTTCSDCGKNCEVPFKPTGNKPVYCSDCFKVNQDSGGGRFDRNDRRGGGRDDRRDYRSGNRDFEERKMHKATCAGCKSKCEVPFKPSGDKPVYCNDCFSTTSGRNGTSKQSNEVLEKLEEKFEEKFEELNKKLDKILRKLESIKPTKEHIIEKPTVKKAEKAEKKEAVKPAKKKVIKKATAKKKVAVKKKTSAKKRK